MTTRDERLDRYPAAERESRTGMDDGVKGQGVEGRRLRAAVVRAEPGSDARLRTPGLVYRVGIRLIDVVVAATALAVSAPLMLVIAVAVRLDSPGPIIFRHKRVGIDRRRSGGEDPRRNGRHSPAGLERRSGAERRMRRSSGRPFTLYKFRTMYVDARARFPELYSYNYSDEELTTLPIKLLVSTKRDPEAVEGPIIESRYEEDPRVTRVGRWLRRTSLDELPNFWNVLIGDMHLVGPRPDIEENIRYYSKRHRIKLMVKPGVTGLAQVKGRGNLSFCQTNEYDLEYAEQRSFLLDMRILVMTFWALFKRDGSY
jgi:lipopolysaccharide/colanic/teichoic acid biosynthesis glycosyltransferase